MAFKLLKRPGKEQDKKIAKKVTTTIKAVSTVKGGLLGRINEIKVMVEKNLGKFKDDYEIITDVGRLRDYFGKCVDNNIISIDTETTGLNPLEDKIVGLCIYTPNEKAAYIPINHTSYVTGTIVAEQLTEQEVALELEVLLHYKPDIIMFNAKFDIRVIRNQLGVKDIYCTWDAYLAGRLLNENEEHKGLKALHKKYCLNGKGDAFSFDELFNGISFDKIPIQVGYLYAAHDAIITYELYRFQYDYLTPRLKAGLCEEYDLQDVSWVFHNIEMPCVSVVADMEDIGVDFDMDYCNQLSEKYNSILQEKLDKFYSICDSYSDKIAEYRTKNPNNKLDDPINIASSSQVAILLYDILHLTNNTKMSARSTGEEVLQKMDKPITKAILEYREVAKLLSTYIDKMPGCVQKDGRVHCSFNQYGADTGRFSSSDPNLQNLPSHAKDIRPMFVATHYDKQVDFDTDEFLEVDKFTELQTDDGWVKTSTLSIGDKLSIDDDIFTISGIEIGDSTVKIFL